MSFETIISTLGFPIACVVALGWYINNFTTSIREDGKEREKELIEAGNAREKILMEANKEFAQALNKASDAITENGKAQAENGKLQAALFERMHVLECKVDIVGTNLEVIKVTLQK